MSVESSSPDTDIGRTESSIPTELADGWRYVMGIGALIALLGVVAILTPLVTSIGLSLLLGVMLLVGALLHVAQAFYAGGFRKSMWQVVLAIAYGFAGAALLVNPLLGLVTLTVILIAFFAVEGMAEILVGLRMRSEPQWLWVVASGVVSLLLAGLLFARLPSSALWAVGLLFGINLLSTGVAMMFVGNIGRKATAAGNETVRGTEPSA